MSSRLTIRKLNGCDSSYDDYQRSSLWCHICDGLKQPLDTSSDYVSQQKKLFTESLGAIDDKRVIGLNLEGTVVTEKNDTFSAKCTCHIDKTKFTLGEKTNITLYFPATVKMSDSGDFLQKILSSIRVEDFSLNLCRCGQTKIVYQITSCDVIHSKLDVHFENYADCVCIQTALK
jgi:hypothetical protein